MFKPSNRTQAQLPLRRSYKPGRVVVLRQRPRTPVVLLNYPPDFDPACALEGAWLPEARQ
jgi:hypothetical protein